MKILSRVILSAALVAAPFVASEALAHAKLLKATPADGSTAASPQMIMLTFNEKLTGKLSGFEVVKADGTKVDVMVSVAGGGTMLHAMPSKPLARGLYKVNWHAVTDDGHRTEGTISFTVK
jgi:methionine-rich copper-binding protein CopC